MRRALTQRAGAIVAGLLAVLLCAFAMSPRLGSEAPEGLAQRFAFDAYELKPADGANFRTVRAVHPDFRNIAGWISAVGASVAMGDADGDGLSNDVCLVEVRNDTVTLVPAPGVEGERYAAFALDLPRAGYAPGTIAPMGCLFADADANGREDLVVYFWGRTPVLFENRGEMSAAGFRPREIVSDRESWFTNAALFSDLDGDGYGDLVFGNYFPDDGAVLDLGGGGSPRMQHSMSRAANAGANRLLLNTGAAEGRLAFEDRSEALNGQVPNGWTLALGAADLNGDLRPELYIANDFGPDRLLLNASEAGQPAFALVEGRRRLTDIRSAVLGRDSFKGMGVDFGDVDGDGRLDIYVSNIAEDYALFESHFLFLREEGEDWEGGVAPFRNASGRLGLARSSWGWDSKLVDMDNDGRLEALQATGFLKGERDRWPELQELAMGNDELLADPAVWPRFAEGDDLSGDRHDSFFVRGDDGRFHDVADEIGLGGASVSRGIATADIDGDGDLDFAVARQWQPSTLYVNRSGQAKPSLLLDLRLSNPDGSTRPAIGAVVTAEPPGGTARIGFSDASNGHSGRRSAEVHFGLDTQPAGPVRVKVAWRDGAGTHARDFDLRPGRHRLVLDQAATAAVTVREPGRDPR